MPPFTVDSFVPEFITRHASRIDQFASSEHVRRWTLVLSVLFAALCAVVAQPHWMAHVCAVLMAFVAAKLLRIEAAMAAAIAGLLVHWGWHGLGLQQPVVYVETLQGLGLAVVGGGAVGLIVRLIQERHGQAREVARLRQLCSLWGQIDDACLKEISIEGKLVAMNEPGQRVMEICDFDSICGSDWLSFWAGDWSASARTAFKSALSGKPARFSGFCPTARGTPKWWDVLLVPVMDRERVLSVLSLSWDVTETVRSQRVLEQAHDEMASLLHNLKDGFFQINADWQLSRINGQASSMLQLPPIESLGKDFRTLFADALPGELRSALDDAMHERIVRHAEVWFAPRQAWYRVNAYPRDGGITVLFSDVSDDVMRFQQSQAAEARLRMSQEIGQFADWQYDLATQQMTLSSQAIALAQLGNEPDACRGAALINLMNPQDRLSFVAAMLDMSEGKVDFDQVVRIEIAPDSDAFRYLRMAGFRLVTKGHPVGLVVGCLQDVTQQKRREQQLVEAEAFSRNIIDAMPLYVGVLDQQGELIAANLSWREFQAKDAPLWAAEGSNYFDRCREAADSGVAEASLLIEAIEAVAEGLSASVRIDYEAAGSTGIHYVISVVPITDGSGRVLVMFEDVSERVRMEAELTLQAQRLELAYEGSNDGLWEWRPDGRDLYVSPRFAELTGYSATEADDLVAWLLRRVDPQHVKELSQAWAGHLERHEPFQLELRFLTAQGWKWFRTTGKAEWSGDVLLRFAGSISDVSEQRELLNRVKASERRFREMVEHLPHAYWEYDVAQGQLSYISPVITRLLGISPEQIHGDPYLWLQLAHPQDLAAATQYNDDVCIRHVQAEVEFRARSVSGRDVWIRNCAYPYRDEEGNVIRMIGIAENISEARYLRDRLFSAQYFDAISGLPNRTMFNEQVALQSGPGSKAWNDFAVFIVAVGRMKWVERSMGQAARDDFIQQAAARLQSTLAGRGYLASLGDGEFAIMQQMDSEVDAGSDALSALLGAFQREFTWQGEAILLPANIGAARFPVDGENAEALLRNANLAVYATQKTGGSGAQFFAPALLETSTDDFMLESRLHEALLKREFMLHYQPKLCLATQRICGAEALIRWNHPEQGLVPPLRFVHLLEENELIVPVGEWCIEEAVAQLADWQRQGLTGFTMAVNVSLKQLGPRLVQHVKAVLERYQVAATSIELELTESIMHEPRETETIVSQLKALGVRIAVDDFGTGYATLGSLRSFVPDTLKIDKSFLRGMAESAADQAIVRGVIDMAHALNMVVVAEGIENEEQRRLLEQNDCDVIQGYLISRPVKAEEFAKVVLADQFECSVRSY